jgi:hypothetical protein
MIIKTKRIRTPVHFPERLEKSKEDEKNGHDVIMSTTDAKRTSRKFLSEISCQRDTKFRRKIASASVVVDRG